MPLDEQVISEVVERYWREYDRYAKLAECVAEKCREMISADVIRGTVQWRAKAADRLRMKLRKLSKTPGERDKLDTVDAAMSRVSDLAGIRVTTYVETDRSRVVEGIEKMFVGPGADGGVEVEVKDGPRFYKATHCQVMLKDEDLVDPYQNLKGLSCEVQVCSLLAHVYNEIEHDLRYKPLSGRLSKKEEDLLDALGHITASGDTIVAQALQAVEERRTETEGEFEDVYDFVARTRSKFENTPSFPENAGQLYDECVALGLDSPRKIDEALLKGEYKARAKELVEKLVSFVATLPPGQLEIDAASSDRLLVLLLERYGDRVRSRHPAGRGRGRGPRILSVEKRFQEMQETHNGS